MCERSAYRVVVPRGAYGSLLADGRQRRCGSWRGGTPLPPVPLPFVVVRTPRRAKHASQGAANDNGYPPTALAGRMPAPQMTAVASRQAVTLGRGWRRHDVGPRCSVGRSAATRRPDPVLAAYAEPGFTGPAATGAARHRMACIPLASASGCCSLSACSTSAAPGLSLHRLLSMRSGSEPVSHQTTHPTTSMLFASGQWPICATGSIIQRARRRGNDDAPHLTS